MPDIFYSGKLSLPMKPLAYMNSIASWIAGAQDGEKIKHDVKMSYNKEISDDVRRYDELALDHYAMIAGQLLSDIEVEGKSVLDAGCGTGALSLLAMEAGASSVTCADISPFMLERCREKIAASAFGTGKADFSVCDLESMDFPDGTFEVVVSSMVLAHVPDPQKAVKEMARVLKGGGMLALSALGTAHWWEAGDAMMRAIAFTPSLWSACFFNRVAFWHRDEKDYRCMLETAGLKDVRTERKVWEEHFDSPEHALDVALATSAAIPLALVPERSGAKRDKLAESFRRSFARGGIRSMTNDVVFAYGRKRESE